MSMFENKIEKFGLQWEHKDLSKDIMYIQGGNLGKPLWSHKVKFTKIKGIPRKRS